MKYIDQACVQAGGIYNIQEVERLEHFIYKVGDNALNIQDGSLTNSHSAKHNFFYFLLKKKKRRPTTARTMEP